MHLSATRAAVWYYDRSDVKVTKKRPLTLDHFTEFCELLPTRVDAEHSSSLTREELEARRLDLMAGSPNR